MKNKYNLSLTQIDKIEKDIMELSSSVGYIDFLSTHYENETYEEIGSILDEYCVGGDYDFIVPESVNVIDIYPYIYSNMEHNLGYDGKYLCEIFDCPVSPDDYDYEDWIRLPKVEEWVKKMDKENVKNIENFIQILRDAIE